MNEGTIEKGTVKDSNEDELKNPQPSPFICGFCGRKFSRKGTYGRHLDAKKGDSIHPAPQVEQLRASVVRRGGPKRATGATERESGPKFQKTEKTTEGPEGPGKVDKTRKSKSEISKTYNSKEEVKVRNKARRKARDLRIKARLAAYEWYISSIGQAPNLGQGPETANEPELEILEKGAENDAESGGAKYAFLVASHVSPSKWPKLGEFPGDSDFTTIMGQLTASSDLLRGSSSSHGASVPEQAFELHAQWQKLAPARKLALWQAESDRALRVHLPGASLHHISRASESVDEKSRQLFEQYSEGEILGMIFTDSET